MKSFLIFIGGFVAGIFATIIVLYLISLGVKSNNSFDKANLRIEYIEVKGKKGNVRLHTGMSKDSVKLLVGKPDAINLDEIGNIRFEKWGYKINNKSGMPKEYQLPDLNIEFEDGRLNGVNQE
jgi:hypothetical protein